MAKRQRSKFSTITRSTKASGGKIKVSSEATDGQPKPYLGYRSGRGMPSAREPWESWSEEGRNNFDKIFGFGKDDFINNKESQDKRRTREQRTKKSSRKKSK